MSGYHVSNIIHKIDWSPEEALTIFDAFKTAAASDTYRGLQYNNYASEIIKKLIDLTDLFLLDIKCINDDICKKNPLVYGNKRHTGYAWKLKNATKLNLEEKIPGKQGIWNYDLK